MQKKIAMCKLVAAVLPLLLSGQVMALPANGVEALIDVSARVIAPLQIQNTGGLSFGTIVGGGNGGTLGVNLDNTVHVTGGVQTINQGAVTSPMAAVFSVTGEPSYAYSVSLPNSSTVENQFGHQLTVGNFTILTAFRYLSMNGDDSFFVGGVLVVPSNVATGAYTGSFTVGVNYN